ncbi:hypothetical protein ScPMuIL_018470 [Solemya velum]
MNQRTYLGTTLIDIAKASVETFMKIRSRDPNSRWDRYMLLTLEDPPANIKAGWKESHSTFMNELKHLTSIGLSLLGPSLKNALDLLNLNRMQTGIDTYGQGRCPFYLEPAVIIVITDGGKLTANNGVHTELNLPMNTVVPGSELTKEPFRWDQRIFGLVLKLPGNMPVDNSYNGYVPSAEYHPIDAMCEVTGGRSYAVTTQKMLNASIESLVQKVQSGVVINFEKIGPDPPLVVNEGNCDSTQLVNLYPSTLSWQNCRKLIYVPRSAQKGYSVGHWPIPEAFWPDTNMPALTPRSSHPNVRFCCLPSDPLVIENLPFDKYEVEASPLTQFILERRQPNVCWQVSISSSAKYSDAGFPFGYLKASSSMTCVNLFVMPYNYPVLLPLLDELFKVHKLKPSLSWKQQFENYLKTMPAYYASPLRRAMARMGAPNLVPDNLDNCLSYSVITYLKKLKNQAKMEMDRLNASVGQKVPLHDGMKVSSRTKTSILQRKDFNQLLQSVGGNMLSLKQELTDYNTFTIAVADKDIKPQYFRNPYDVPREGLLDQIARMRTNFLQSSFSNTKLVDEDQLHSIPVQQMGNYQDYLKKQPSPLRELENTPVRLHMFGNPFKVNKNITIDEADEAVFGQPSSPKKRQSDSPPASPGPKKRKPGPLPKDFIYQRPTTPPPSAPSSPEPQIKIEVNEELEDSPEKDQKPLIIDIKEEPEEVEEEDEESVPIKSEVITNHVLENGNDPCHPKDNDILRRNSVNNSKKAALIWTHNTRLKHIVYKELKKPGRNYEHLFNQLHSVEGSVDTKCGFVRDVIKEAGRFKKKVLIQLLEQFEMSLTSVEIKRQKSSSIAR